MRFTYDHEAINFSFTDHRSGYKKFNAFCCKSIYGRIRYNLGVVMLFGISDAFDNSAL